MTSQRLLAPAPEVMSAEERAATADGVRSPLLRRSLRRAVERPITEGGTDHEIRLREAVFRRSLALADVVAAAVALVVCVDVLHTSHLSLVALLALPLVVVTGKAHGLYDRDELVLNKTTMDEAPQLFQCATLFALLVVLLQPWFVDGSLGADQILALWGTLLVAALLSRRLARYIARRVTTPERCLFVGSRESFDRLRSKFPDGDVRAEIVARMSLEGLSEPQLVDIGASALHAQIEQRRIHRVIIEPSEALPQMTLDFVREAKATGVRVSLLPRILEVVGSTIEVDDVDGITLLGVRRFGLSRSSKLIKRSFDAVGAGLGLIAMSPFLLGMALAIRLETRGPVLFRQLRIGRDGQPFTMLKFRTMVDGADKLKPDLHAVVDPAMGLFKLPDDPRITRVGRRLRQCSLDELPAAHQRPARRDEPRRPAAARRRRGRADQGAGPFAAAAHAGDNRPLADPGIAGAARGDDQARLSLCRRLVAVGRREDPHANRHSRVRTARHVSRTGAAGPAAWATQGTVRRARGRE